MDVKSYRSKEAGRTLRVPSGYTAFIPAKLPPSLKYDAELVLSLSKADAALSELSGLGRQLPNPHLLIAPYMRREALLSSRIEGTRATLSDLLLQEAYVHSDPVPDDLLEVQNHIDALEFGRMRLSELPLSLRLVREIHGKLMEGVRGEHGTPGAFRTSQNWIGPPGCTLNDALYVPPPPHQMLELLGDWELFLHVRDMFPDLIQCAIMHEQFEAIHPFIDGNGRIGRLLVTLFLVERGRLSQPLLYLSAYIGKYKQQYFDLLQLVRTDGDWPAWILFFLSGVEEIAKAAVQQSGQLSDLREVFRQRLHRKAKALELVDHLFINPYVTVSRAAGLLQTTTQTARQAILTLGESKILTEITGRSWGRIYLAQPIWDVIQV
jgi:Fic family protein